MEEGKIEATTVKAEKPRRNKNYAVIGLLVIAIILTGTTGYFAYQYDVLNKNKNKLQAQIDDVNKQLAAKIAVLDTINQPLAKSTTDNSKLVKATVIPQSLRDNTVAAINSMNTAALEGYLAPSVNVVFAASEKAGLRTPTQAVGDLDYLKSATSPWNFTLPAATLTSYKTGFYGKYFGDNTMVGLSANKYVVSFGVNASGKIDVIFVAASGELLI